MRIDGMQSKFLLSIEGRKRKERFEEEVEVLGSRFSTRLELEVFECS